MTDTDQSKTQIESTWRSFGSALGAGAGALVALISLLADVPLAVACGRGALMLFTVQLVMRLGLFALSRTTREPRSSETKSKASEANQEQRPAA